MSDTPRTDAEEFFAKSDFNTWIVTKSTFPRQLERELSAATSELAATKEQLRVAREAISAALDTDELDDIRESDAFRIIRSLFVQLYAFTQPNLSADSPEGGNPAKGEGGVPLTFPA